MFGTIEKLRVYLGDGGTLDGNAGREALLAVLDEVEKIRGELEALKIARATAAEAGS